MPFTKRIAALSVCVLAAVAAYMVVSTSSKGSLNVENSSDLLSCYEGSDTEFPVFEKSILECLSSKVAYVASTEGYGAANDAIVETFRIMHKNSGHYCSQVNDAMFRGALTKGEKSLDILNTYNSLCSFAIVHSIGALAVETFYPDSIKGVTDVCSAPKLVLLDADSYSTQCWHGAGYGMYKASNRNDSQTSKLCDAAPSDGWVQNCYEGLYEYVRHSKWLEPQKTIEPYTTVVLRCSTDSSLTVEYSRACYKNIAIELAVDDLQLTNARSVLDSYRKVCATESNDVLPGKEAIGSKSEACALGYAMYAGIVAAGEDNRSGFTYKDAFAECDKLFTLPQIKQCYVRVTVSVGKTLLRPQGVPLEDILEVTPVSLQAWLSETYTTYLSKQSGRSTNESYEK